MSNDDWKTLRVPPEAYDAAKAQKEKHGRTWGQQVVRPTDDGEGDDVDVDALAEALAGHIDYPDSQDVTTIASRLDDLETRLPEKVGDELEERMR